MNEYAIKRQIQPLNPQIGFNVNSIQTQIQPLNPQIGFNVNVIQRQIQPLNHNRIQCEFHSKTDSTVKPSNRI